MRSARNKIVYPLRTDILPTLARLSPLLLMIVLGVNLLVVPSYSALYVFLAFLIVKLSNWVIKHIIIKPLYALLGQKSLPLLGLGERPPGATSCGVFLDGLTATSFGMPSGHSQGAWAIATYIILNLFKPKAKPEPKDTKPAPKDKLEPKAKLAPMSNYSLVWKSMSGFSVVLAAAYISYSRVYIEGCHTIEQVIVGGILGVISGALIFSFEERGVQYIKNKLKQ